MNIIIKISLKLTLVLIINFSCFSQNKGKENLNLVFYNDCTNEIIKPEFEIESIPELSSRILNVYVKRGDLIGQYSTTLKTINDTIRIPKILFSFGSALHSKEWSYLNCENICDGTEIDYYSNGKIRIKGIFNNGKPIEISDYNQNGKLLTQTIYENLTLNYKRVNFFNENEELIEYEIYNNKKRKTVIRTFDNNGNLINKEIEKRYKEKNE